MRHADLADAPAVLPDVPALLRARRGIEVRQIADVLRAVRRKQNLVHHIAFCLIRLVVAPAVKRRMQLGYLAAFLFDVIGHRRLQHLIRRRVNAVERRVVIAIGRQIARGDGEQQLTVLLAAAVDRLLHVLFQSRASGDHVENVLFILSLKVDAQAQILGAVALHTRGIHRSVRLTP